MIGRLSVKRFERSTSVAGRGIAHDSLNTETTYDWENSASSVPVNIGIAKVTRIGGQLVSVGGALRYWVESPNSGPEGVGFRFNVTLLFPK